MIKYGMFIKSGKDLIHTTQQATLKEATQYFADIKQMPIKDFKKIFIVTKIKKQ